MLTYIWMFTLCLTLGGQPAQSAVNYYMDLKDLGIDSEPQVEPEIVWPEDSEDAYLDMISALIGDDYANDYDADYYRKLFGPVQYDITEDDLPWYSEVVDEPMDTDLATMWLNQEDFNLPDDLDLKLQLENLVKHIQEQQEKHAKTTDAEKSLLEPELQTADKRSDEELESYWLAQAFPAISFRKPAASNGEADAPEEKTTGKDTAIPTVKTIEKTTSASGETPVTSSSTQLPRLMTAEKRGMLEVPMLRPGTPADSSMEKDRPRRKRSLQTVINTTLNGKVAGSSKMSTLKANTKTPTRSAQFISSKHNQESLSILGGANTKKFV